MKYHPLQSWDNISKKKVLISSQPFLGLFVVTGSSLISECSATTGINWIAVDMEASPATRYDLIHIAQSLNGSSVTLFVRVAQNNQQYIESALDIGAHGIIVPKVCTSKQASEAVDAVYYAPIGSRGMNPIRCSAYFKNLGDYLSRANSSILCIPQIETAKAVNNISEIAKVKGVSGLFIGCGDLANDFGTPGEFDTILMQNARTRILNACTKHNLIPGIFAYSEELAKKYIHEGFKMIGIGNEIKFLRNAIEGSINNILDDTQELNECVKKALG